MAARKIDLKKRCFFVLSGISNSLGKSLATEMCRRFKPGSVVLFIESSEQTLQDVKKEIHILVNEIEVVVNVVDWQKTSDSLFRKMLADVLSKYEESYFELALIIHNEGSGATDNLIEPQDSIQWLSYIEENLYTVVRLNQEFLKLTQLEGVESLIINITSSLPGRPLNFSSLKCSCKQAREMYFRAMAEGEVGRKNIAVLNYSSGVMESHVAVADGNNNVIEVADLVEEEHRQKLPRIRPFQSTLKLINILEEMSFCSGHDVDYYDTYNL